MDNWLFYLTAVAVALYTIPPCAKYVRDFVRYLRMSDEEVADVDRRIANLRRWRDGVVR